MSPVDSKREHMEGPSTKHIPGIILSQDKH